MELWKRSILYWKEVIWESKRAKDGRMYSSLKFISESASHVFALGTDVYSKIV